MKVIYIYIIYNKFLLIKLLLFLFKTFKKHRFSNIEKKIFSFYQLKK